MDERKARAKAACAWLETQEINLKDGAVMAVDLLCIALANMTDDRAELLNGIRAAQRDIETNTLSYWTRSHGRV